MRSSITLPVDRFVVVVVVVVVVAVPVLTQPQEQSNPLLPELYIVTQYLSFCFLALFIDII